MITDAMYDLSFEIAMQFVGLLTWAGITPPASVSSDIAFFVGQFAGVGVWVPWAVLASAAGLSVSVWAVCFGVKAVRALLAHVPAVGGAG